MNANFINPFVESTVNVLTTMAALEPKAGKPFLKEGNSPHGDLTGVIGLVGEKITGSMAIVFPAAPAIQIASNMLGEEFTELCPDVIDCVGELTNMISGGARAKLGEQGYVFNMAIPSMIQGKDHSIYHKTMGPIVVIPFTIDAGEFFIEACFVEKA